MNRVLIKRFFITALLFSLLVITSQSANAQCSICTRTAQQMGEKPAKGLNAGILYLAFTPLTIVGVIAFRWWKKQKSTTEA